MKRLGIVALAFGCSFGPALADSPLAESAIASDSANPGGQILPKNKSAIQATYNSDEKIGTITGTFKLPSSKNVPETNYISIAVQSPIAQGTTYTNTATLDGLTKASAASFQFVHKHGGYVADSTEAAWEKQDNQDACWKLYDLIMTDIPSNETANDLPAPPKAVHPQSNCNQGLLDNVQAQRVAKDQDYKNDLVSPADQVGKQKRFAQVKEDSDIEEAFSKGLDNLHNRLVPTPADLWLWSANGKVGYEQHLYYDPDTLVKNTANKTPWQVGVSVGYIPVGFQWSYNLSFKYQEAFLDSDLGMPQVKCINSGATCVNGFIGAPALQNKALITGDIRWVTKLGSFPIGFDPGFTYDAIQHSEAVQFPIYLVSDASNTLTGGIRYDWTSTSHVSTVGLFVSSAFTILE